MSRQQNLFQDAADLKWERADRQDHVLAEVVFNRPMETVYLYLVPDALRGLLQPGQRVKAPLGRGEKPTIGFCVGLLQGLPEEEMRPQALPRKWKDVLEVLDREPLINQRMLDLTRWIAEYYLCSWGQVLHGVIPAAVKKNAGTREIRLFQLASLPQQWEDWQLPAKQRAVLQVLQEVGTPLKIDELTAAAQCGTSPVNALVKKGLIQPIREREQSYAPNQAETQRQQDLTLAPQQQRALDAIIRAIELKSPPPADPNTTGGETPPIPAKPESRSVPLESSPNSNGTMPAGTERQAAIATALSTRVTESTTPATESSIQARTLLLHGVTGSGKTEVYIRAIRHAVEFGRQAIVLVPEISLTPQTIRRFRHRFDSVAVLHSHLTDAERHWQWQQIAQGKVQVVVGARSAIFAPCPRLGLIVIDEEHENTFKQESVPRYHAREVARKRAELENIPLVLGTATPTLESWWKASHRQYELISMPERIEQLPLPPVVVVDTLNDPQIRRGQNIGRALQNAIDQALKQKGQVILFFNMRGFTPVLFCRHCGAKLSCPHCATSLTWHKDKQLCVCHTCDYTSAIPSHCPSCGNPGLRHLGSGTQRLEEEVRRKFPGVAVQRMDSDSMRKPGSHDEALERFRHGEVSILLGTQMIAKGLDFPNVTLVGVVDADTSLHQIDFRASERTFQLISQVAGRTGRSARGGRVLVQTMQPDAEPIRFAASHDYVGFARMEMQHRQERRMPPYSALVRVILRNQDEPVLEQASLDFSDILRERANQLPGSYRILGPAPAPLARHKDFFRYQILISGESHRDHCRLLQSCRKQLDKIPGIEYVLDVDPLQMR